MSALSSLKDYESLPSSQRTDFAKSVHENGRELFICFAKNKWPLEFLDIVVNEADFFDKHIHGKRIIDTGYQNTKNFKIN